MDELLEALKRKRGAKIIVIDADMDMEEEDESVENLEEVEEEKDMATKAKDMLGRDPFEGLKEKAALEMESDDPLLKGDDDMDEDVELEGLESEVADPQIMNRLKAGKKPKGIMERMQANLMKKK